MKVAKIHEKISNSRKDNLHKVSTELIKSYDVICLEDLNIKKMLKNHKLSKHIADCGWSAFINMLQYKAEWNNKTIIKIDRFFPSSKTCSLCGWIKEDLELNDRVRYRDWETDRKSTRLNSSHSAKSRMPSSA